MTERERLLTVLKGETPDVVPWFADIGHWYRSEAYDKWDLFGVTEVDTKIFDIHRDVKAGAYIDAGSLHKEEFEDGVEHIREMQGELAVEKFITKIGEVTMERRWSPVSFSWDVTKLMIQSPKDLEVLTYAMERKKIIPNLEYWDTMEEYYGEIGIGFPHMGYTALGSLVSYYMGVENTIYASFDYPELLKKYCETYNSKQMEIVNICASSPAPHLFFGDNLSSDVQPPPLFNEYSYDHYKNIADTLHKAGKTVSAHLDGMLNNIIGVVAEAGIDVADACTPAPTGDLTPSQMREQAGNDMILMGGIAPTKWLPETSDKEFVEHVKEWLDLKKTNSRFVQSAGDQVPPGTEYKRIKLVREIVDEFGQY